MDVWDLWLVICARQLHLDPVGIIAIDPTRSCGLPRIEALPLKLCSHPADLVVFDRNTVVIHPGIRVLKQRQEVLPETEEAVVFTLTHHGQAEMSLIEVPRAFNVGYV